MVVASISFGLFRSSIRDRSPNEKAKFWLEPGTGPLYVTYIKGPIYWHREISWWIENWFDVEVKLNASIRWCGSYGIILSVWPYAYAYDSCVMFSCSICEMGFLNHVMLADYAAVILGPSAGAKKCFFVFTNLLAGGGRAKSDSRTIVAALWWFRTLVEALYLLLVCEGDIKMSIILIRFGRVTPSRLWKAANGGGFWRHVGGKCFETYLAHPCKCCTSSCRNGLD